MDTLKRWYVVYTMPKCERKVAHLLASKKIETYCPLNKVHKELSGKRKATEDPLFNNYVFVFASSQEHAVIRQSGGVINFVYWLDSPVVVREEEIRTIKNFINECESIKLERMPVNTNDRILISNNDSITGINGTISELRKTNTVKVSLPSLGYQLSAEVGKINIKVISQYKISQNLAS